MGQASPFIYARLGGPGATAAAAGAVIIRTGQGNLWVQYSPSNAASYPGGAIAVFLQPTMPGQSNPAILAGPIDPDLFSLGSGAAGPVFAGTAPSRSGSLAIGTVDTAGMVTLVPSYATTSSVGTLAGRPFATAPPTANQVPVFDGQQWTFGQATGGNQGQTNVALVNGLNSNVAAAGLSLLLIGGPSAAFSIDGISPGTSNKAGLTIVVVNTTSQQCTLVDKSLSVSTAGNQLNTMFGGQPVVLKPLRGAATLVYDTTNNWWAVTSVSAYSPTVDRVDIREFNVQPGNTSFDSSVGIQSAIDLGGALGLPVYVGPGSWRISQPLVPFTSNQDIAGPVAAPQSPLAHLRANDPSGLYWGGGHLGPIFWAGPTSLAQPPTYIVEGNFTWLQLGGSSPNGGFPVIFLSEYPTASFNGMTALTFEMMVNAGTIATGDDNFFVSRGSKTTHSVTTQAIRCGVTSTGPGPWNVQAQITTLITGTPTITTITTSGTPMPSNTDTALALTYDGATFRMYIAGSLVASTACTGAVVQNWWEDCTIGSSVLGTGTIGAGGTGPGLWPLAITDHVGPRRVAAIRKSKTARYTASTYTPKTTDWVPADIDANTDLAITFNATYRNARMPTAIVGACGHPVDFGLIVAAPANVWVMIRNSIGLLDSGPSTITLRNIDFQAYTDAISVENCVALRTVDCSFSGTRGITRTGSSYYANDFNPRFSALPSAGASCSWAICSVGGLTSLHNPFLPTINANWGIVFSGGGGNIIENLQINTIRGQGAIYLNGAQTLLLGGGAGDEGGACLDTPLICTMNQGNNPNNVTWIGGGLFNSTGPATGACVLIDGGTDYEFNCEMGIAGFVTAVYKFVSPPSNPVQHRGEQGFGGLFAAGAWIDGSNTSLVITSQEGMPHVITYPSDADYTPPVNDSLYGLLIVKPPGGGLTGTRKLILPTNTNKTYTIRNSTSQSVNVIHASGTGVTIATGVTATVYDDGTNIV